MSIKKSIVLTLVLCIVVAFLLSPFLVLTAQQNTAIASSHHVQITTPTSFSPQALLTQTAVPTPLATAMQTPLTILPLGDSITLGTGSTTKAGYRLALWQELQADSLQVAYVGSLSTGPQSMPDKRHEGHSGWRIDVISKYIASWLTIYHPQVILLHIGTNDIVQNYHLDSAPERLNTLLDQITTFAPQAIVIVAQITPLGDSAMNREVIRYNQAIPEIVVQQQARGHHIGYVDMYHAVPIEDIGDKIHPNDAGYKRIAHVWYLAIESLLIGHKSALPQ